MFRNLLLGSLAVLLLAPTAEARHDVHAEYRDRIEALDGWHRESLERLRCSYERERAALDRELRRARRLCGPEREMLVERLMDALERVECNYRDETRELQHRYVCQRRDIDAWYRLARLSESRHGHRDHRHDGPYDGRLHDRYREPHTSFRWGVHLGW